MISNYHTASSGPESDYYYTFGGFDDGNPNNPSQGAFPTTGNGRTTGQSLNATTPIASNTATTSKTTKGGGRARRTFGWGRGRGKNSSGNGMTSSDTVSAESMGGQSLGYSVGSSQHSIGDSSASTGFSRMIKVLDAEDAKHQRVAVSNNGGSSLTHPYHRRVPSAGQSVGGQSAASSLNYSDSDASYTRFGVGTLTRSSMSQRSLESTDYSTDASESQLEGSKLIQMLMNEPKNGPPPPTFQNQKEWSHATGALRVKTATGSPTTTIAGAGTTSSSNTPTASNSSNSASIPTKTMEEHAFDLQVEAARAPTMKTPTKARGTETTATTTSDNGASRPLQQNQPKATPTKSSPTKASPTKASPVRRSSSRTSKTTTATSTTSSTNRSPANSVVNSVVEPPSPSKRADLPSSTRPSSTTRSSSGNRGKSEKQGWACTLEAIEEAIPSNIKTMLRPYLCGIL